MSQTPEKEKKNRFQISREVQEEFVNGVAQTMLSLAETAGKWKKPWTADSPMGMPFCPMTGREYGGANMVRLMLTGIVKGHEDDRWMTFKQLQKYQEEHPELNMKITRGEHGVKLLRPEEIVFTVEEDGRWKFLSQEEIKQIEAAKAEGREVPDIQRKMLFCPFTVFNAAQVEGFPSKEQPAHVMTAIERNEFVERFIASSGIPVEHHGGDALYNPASDLVKMPFPQRFTGTDEYYATKLHEFYHATGHEERENRLNKQSQTLKGYALEEMRAEMFSMLAGARLNLPMPESNSAAYIDHWNQTFSGGDVKAVFQAATEAAWALTTMHQFESGEQPKAQWFPKSETWRELVNMQKERDAATGADFQNIPQAGPRSSEPEPRSAPPSLAESAAAFQATDDPVAKARLLLQNPDFLDMALKQDPQAVQEFASLCSSLSMTLHMEMDEQARMRNNEPAPASRMRM